MQHWLSDLGVTVKLKITGHTLNELTEEVEDGYQWKLQHAAYPTTFVACPVMVLLLLLREGEVGLKPASPSQLIQFQP